MRTRPIDAVLLAGGLGTRLRGVVDQLPKALAPVAGRPFVAYLLDALERAGIRHAVLATGYLGDHVEAAIGARWGAMRVSYSRENKSLGTGGALRKAVSKTTGGPVLVLNADTYLRFDPQAFATAVANSAAACGIALAQVDDVQRYGRVETRDGCVVAFHEKGGAGPGWINAGVYYLSQRALASLPDQEAFSLEQAVLPEWVKAGDLLAYTDTSDFIDIGIPADYESAQRLAPAWSAP